MVGIIMVSGARTATPPSMTLKTFRVPATREVVRYDTKRRCVCTISSILSQERVFLAVTTPGALDLHVPSNALLIFVAHSVHEVAQRLVCALTVVADAHDCEQHVL